MRTSQYFLATLKEIPSQTESISHQLMLRSGMIRQLSSGLYSWLPTGLRVLKKVENIIREEMNKSGAIEVSMPVVQPAKLWKESGRWKKYGKELLHFIDRNKRSFVLGPTHEEIFTALIKNELHSYKQLPLNLFQIQTKFRDEIRPRFGVIRAREFLMKDAYSFHTSRESLQETYEKMHEIYRKIFTRMGLDFCIVQASTGSIGGDCSHEFQIITQSGEDTLIISDSSNYAANINFAEALSPRILREKATEKMKLIDTKNIKTIFELTQKLNFPIEKIVKTILVRSKKGSAHKLIALIIRGDHTLNFVKAEKLPQVDKPLTFATEEEIRSVLNVSPGYIGPVNMPVPIVIDRTVAVMNDFIAGANIEGKHFFGINWDRDVETPVISDLRNVEEGDPSPDGRGVLKIHHGIEVGHIFQLGTQYSKLMNAVVQGKDGHLQEIMMGCYGIGITRLVAAAIEQNHDSYGITWPSNIAPFQIAILPINIHKSYHVQQFAQKIYTELIQQGFDVLMDDRREYTGRIFSDIELIGIPHIVIISDHNIKNKKIEYKHRKSHRKYLIKLDEIAQFLTERLSKKQKTI